MTDHERADADGGWKDIIEDFTEEFFAFYFPQVHAAIDFTRAVTFLDTELRQVAPDAFEGKRHADRLLRVAMKDGTEQWLFVHVEVQGETKESEQDFAERMFTTFYRIRDRHGRSVISLAVLTDPSPEFRPCEFREQLLGREILFRFPTAKLIDRDPDELAALDQPFALVSRIQLAYNELRRDTGGTARYGRKTALTRDLYRKGYDRIRLQA